MSLDFHIAVLTYLLIRLNNYLLKNLENLSILLILRRLTITHPSEAPTFITKKKIKIKNKNENDTQSKWDGEKKTNMHCCFYQF